MRSVTSPIRDCSWLITMPPLGLRRESSCQARPSRAISAVASDGPQLPAGYGRGTTPSLFQPSRIGSIQRQAAATSSLRMNSVGLPRTTSINSRS